MKAVRLLQVLQKLSSLKEVALAGLLASDRYTATPRQLTKVCVAILFVRVVGAQYRSVSTLPLRALDLRLGV
jgi:hypothetical protein